jgi:hypothetical protein
MIYPMPPTRPAHLILLDLRHSNNIWRSYQIVEIAHKAADILVFKTCRYALKKFMGGGEAKKKIRKQNLFLEFITVQRPVTLDPPSNI